MERCHAHGGIEFFIGSCISSNYINQGKPSGFSFHQKSLPYRSKHFSLTIHLGSHRLRPLVSKIIPDFARFFNDFFFTGNLNIQLGFSICQPRSSSQGFKRTHQGPRALMFILLHILWHDQDLCCMSSGLIKSRFSSSSFFIIISFCFLLFGTLGLHGAS